MGAIPALATPSTSRSETRRVRRAPAMLALVLLAIGVPSAAQDPIPAVWKERKLSFAYSSSVSMYSCNALADRVKSVLRAVGARDDVNVRVSGCYESIAPSDPRMDPRGSTTTSDPFANRFRDPGMTRRQSVNVYARFMLPTEVTPEVRSALEKDKSRRELLSHVTGDPAPKFNDPVLFAAQRQLVTLSHKTIGVIPEECELLDQVSGTVFRQLGVRVVSRNFNCSTGSEIPPQVVVEALLATPYPIGNPHDAPAAGKDDADPGAPAASEEDPAEPPAEETRE
jgi:hypothetical protein